MGWRDKAYVCAICGWHGMCSPMASSSEAVCPECGAAMLPRTWRDTWGVTFLILGVVVATVLFVAYFRS